jgi:ATP-dependent Lon protease
METPSLLPAIPVRNTVVFPGTTVPLVVGRTKSVAALKAAQSRENLLVVLNQKNTGVDEPTVEDLHTVGTLCRIESVSSNQNGGQKSFQVVVTGLSRYTISELSEAEGHLVCRGETTADVHGDNPLKTEALFSSLKELSKDLITLLPVAQEALAKLIDRLEDPSQLANLCAAYLNLPLPQKQQLLEETNLDLRLEKLMDLLNREREVLALQKDIQNKMSERMSKQQREHLLREQLRAIREELGEEGAELQDEIRKKLDDAKLPEEAKKVADEELKRLESLPSASAEYHVIRSYLDWLANMPWAKQTEDSIDLALARQVLDEDHYGLDSVKKRILQYLAVAKLKNDLRGPILCLVGPPGVGKTSIGQSIARALGRKFARVSLGGVRDEAEIRGHRRTYIGAMPGRLVQNIKRVGVNNPVLMLDEIDKLSHSFHGDPAAAMLEVLDPEQNKNFVDHYLDVPFDLSNTFFIATANVVDTIPAALRDRMEIIDISGYTAVEKRHIARKYLLPKEMQEHGLKPEHLTISDENLDYLIAHYTREAGVRNLRRKIAALCRYTAEKIVLGSLQNYEIQKDQLVDALGVEKFHNEEFIKAMRPGVVTGLAWTPVGGDILFIESTKMSGTGQLTLTGQLGDVMKESAQIALSLVRTASDSLSKDFAFDKYNIHLHVPSGAIPKDGPSAGVTMLTSLASLLLNKPVDTKTAMSGEITLRGAVLPVGGIKEKVLAAHRAGMTHIILPKRNKADLTDVPEDVKSTLKFSFIETTDEVLELTLGLKPKPNTGTDAPPHSTMKSGDKTRINQANLM